MSDRTSLLDGRQHGVVGWRLGAAKSLNDADKTSQEMNEVLLNTREERTALEDECSSMKEKVLSLESQLETLNKAAKSQDAEALIAEAEQVGRQSWLKTVHRSIEQ